MDIYCREKLKRSASTIRLVYRDALICLVCPCCHWYRKDLELQKVRQDLHVSENKTEMNKLQFNKPPPLPKNRQKTTTPYMNRF